MAKPVKPANKMPAVKLPKGAAVSVQLVKPRKPAAGSAGRSGASKAGKKGC